jgi:hypothetical protein
MAGALFVVALGLLIMMGWLLFIEILARRKLRVMRNITLRGFEQIPFDVQAPGSRRASLSQIRKIQPSPSNDLSNVLGMSPDVLWPLIGSYLQLHPRRRADEARATQIEARRLNR